MCVNPISLHSRCACPHLSWSTSSPASASSSCPPQSRRVAAWGKSPWLSAGSSCWPMADRDMWRWRSTEIWRSDKKMGLHSKRNCFRSRIWSIFWHPFHLYRRWRCRRPPSCSCESPVWSCEFMAERRLSRPIWRPRPICGTWWSKKCGPGATWPTNTRWWCCDQRLTLWAHAMHVRELIRHEYINKHSYFLASHALVSLMHLAVDSGCEGTPGIMNFSDICRCGWNSKRPPGE